MRSKAPSTSVSFRLPDPLFQKLSAEAEAEGLSIGESARRLLVAVLQDEDRLRVLEEAQQTRLEISRLRADVATTLETVLLNVTQTPPEAVRKWVSEKLRR